MTEISGKKNQSSKLSAVAKLTTVAEYNWQAWAAKANDARPNWQRQALKAAN